MDVQDISAFYNPEHSFVETRLCHVRDSLILLIAFDKKEDIQSGADVKSRYLFYGRTSEPTENSEDIFLDSIKVSPGLIWETDKQVILSFEFHQNVPGHLFVLEMFDTRLRQLKLFNVPRWQDETIVLLSSGNKPYLRPYLKKNDTITVRYQPDPLYVQVFKREFPPALPPFITEERKLYPADTSFTILTGDYSCFSDTGTIQSYIFSCKDSVPGPFLFCGKNSFPDISLPEEMVKPLTYLLPESQFNQISRKKDKTTIDSVWLTIAGSEERGRELIKGYYSRVEASNHYFTTFREGWKTDQGMLYILFGPPHEVYRHMKSEEWIYHEFLGKGSYTFYFERNSSGELVLHRKPEYEKIWKEAIKQWRSGIIPK